MGQLATLYLAIGCTTDNQVARVGADTAQATAPPAATQPIPADSTPATTDSTWTAGVVASHRVNPEVALLISVRTARHPGFERMVFEFQDGSLPNYKVSYIDRPVIACGSGEPVPLAGDAWIEVDLQPANAHTDQGRPTVEARALAPGYPNLLELRLTCDFEAEVTWVAGLRSPNRFRVLELREPARLVVDVR